jgi:hypothetical protein
VAADMKTGTSVRTIFRLSPQATVFAIDPFKGSWRSRSGPQHPCDPNAAKSWLTVSCRSNNRCPQSFRFSVRYLG